MGCDNWFPWFSLLLILSQIVAKLPVLFLPWLLEEIAFCLGGWRGGGRREARNVSFSTSSFLKLPTSNNSKHIDFFTATFCLLLALVKRSPPQIVHQIENVSQELFALISNRQMKMPLTGFFRVSVIFTAAAQRTEVIITSHCVPLYISCHIL